MTDTAPAPAPSRPVRAALVVLAVLPIAVAVVRAIVDDWFPIGDDALLYIRVRDVLTAHHPLLGSWSSASLSVGENINNPGPIYQDLLAPAAHLLDPGDGAAVGVGLANTAAVVGAAVAAHHIGGWAMQRWVLLMCAALSWTMGSELLFDIWQAHALLLPFLAYLVLLVGISAGRHRLVPWLAFVASVLVQTHISYTYILAAITPVALAIAWWDHRPLTRERIRAGLTSRTTVVTAVLLAVVWAQTIVEQLFGEGRGNLARLASSAGGGDVHIGAGTATKIVAAVVALPPWWLRSGFSTSVPSTRLTPTADGPQLFVPALPSPAASVIGILLVLAVLAVLAWRCRVAGLRLESNAAALSAAGVLAAIACLTMLTVGPVGLAAHHVRWVWSFTVFVHVAALWAAVALARHHLAGRRGLERLISGAVVAAVAVLTVVNLPKHAQQEGPVADTEAMPALRDIFEQVDVLAPHQPVVYDISTLRVFEPYSAAVMMRLQELGIEFRVTDEPMVRQLGNRRRADGTETTTIYQLEGSAALLFEGPGCVIARADGLGDDDADRAAAIAQTLADGLTGGAITVETVELTPEEAALADAAHMGDGSAARRAVYDGHLARWAAGGHLLVDQTQLPPDVDISDDEARTATFGLVERWVVSTYGLFARPGPACDDTTSTSTSTSG